MAVIGEQEHLAVRATLDAPLDLERFGARIERPDTRAIASRWRAARVEDGEWVVDLEAPVAPEPATGDGTPPAPDPGYVVVWRTSDPEPLSFEHFEPYPAT